MSASSATRLVSARQSAGLMADGANGTGWSARPKDWEPGEPIGWGSTRIAAVRDLSAQTEPEPERDLELSGWRITAILAAGAICAPAFLLGIWFACWLLAGAPV